MEQSQGIEKEINTFCSVTALNDTEQALSLSLHYSIVACHTCQLFKAQQSQAKLIGPQSKWPYKYGSLLEYSKIYHTYGSECKYEIPFKVKS